MAGRRPPIDRRGLSDAERAAWDAVARTVNPLPRRRPVAAVSTPRAEPTAASPPMVERPATDSSRRAARPAKPPLPLAPAARGPAERLDSTWERRIGKGLLIPDRSLDLHGHSLHAAHALFNRWLAQAEAENARVLLVVTGKARESGQASGERARGAIRAEIGHWIETSPHADRIASVRGAHPRHGGAGALYLILRRKR